MKKLLVVGASAIGALAMSTLLGGGVAAADDYAGMTYGEAAEEADSPIVASRVGDQLSDDECLVIRSQATPFTSADDGSAKDGTQFYLNCNAGVASETEAGNSAASPVGRDTQAAIDEETAKAEAEAAAAQNAEDELTFAGEVPGEAGQVAGG